jgi:hypothetical protein
MRRTPRLPLTRVRPDLLGTTSKPSENVAKCALRSVATSAAETPASSSRQPKALASSEIRWIGTPIGSGFARPSVTMRRNLSQEVTAIGSGCRVGSPPDLTSRVRVVVDAATTAE